MENLTKAITGDKEAFVELYIEYRQEIFQFVLGRIGHREDALDITGDVFLGAFAGIQSFRADSSFRTWLYAICKHKLNDYFAQKGIRQQEVIINDTDAGNQEDSSINENVQNYNGMNILESKIDLENILKQLAPSEQEILLLHNINGMDFTECGQILKISTGYARVFHFRAMEKARSIANS